jgi:hypothetical protein
MDLMPQALNIRAQIWCHWVSSSRTSLCPRLWISELSFMSLKLMDLIPQTMNESQSSWEAQICSLSLNLLMDLMPLGRLWKNLRAAESHVHGLLCCCSLSGFNGLY